MKKILSLVLSAVMLLGVIGYGTASAETSSDKQAIEATLNLVPTVTALQMSQPRRTLQL